MGASAVPEVLELDYLIARFEAAAAEAAGARPLDNDRRTAPRFTRDQVADLRVSIAGHAATLVNVSSTGILIETGHRVCPGHVTDVFLRVGTERRTVRALVLRCEVHGIRPHPHYRAALRFEAQVALPQVAA